MAAIRVMAVFQGASGLSEDRCVNTFYFYDGEGGPALEDQHDVAKAKVADFYNGVGVSPNVQNYAIAGWLSPWINRAFQLISYDMADPITGGLKRPPHPSNNTIGAPKSATGLPEEVAVCLTLHGAPPASKRRRGRVYLGPLCNSALEPGTSSAMARPNPLFINDLRMAAARLTVSAGALDMIWAIRSTVPSENYVTILDGYVDDAFDTQRRRGPDASTRYAWTGLVG